MKLSTRGRAILFAFVLSASALFLFDLVWWFVSSVVPAPLVGLALLSFGFLLVAFVAKAMGIRFLMPREPKDEWGDRQPYEGLSKRWSLILLIAFALGGIFIPLLILTLMGYR